jgi:outer membrane protein OmpA-like peptidoglycan-associated protein
MRFIKYHFLVSSLLLTIASHAQSGALKKANKHFANQSYAQAIPYYEKVYKKDSSDKLLLSNLGDCYRLTNNTNGALKCYGALVKYGKASSIHQLYYGQALLEKGNKEDAKNQFSKFNDDVRGKNLSLIVEKYNSFFKNKDAYKVELANFNSSENDFCAVNFNNTVVFASSRNKSAWINRKHGWTNGSYIGLLTTEKDASGKQLAPKQFMGDLNSKYNDGPICFSKDMQSVFFTRNTSNSAEKSVDGNYKLQIYKATMNRNGFDRVYILSFNNKDYNYAHPSLSGDGNYLYFASDMPGGLGGMDIYVSKKGVDGNWGKPENLGDKVNTPGNEVFPFIAGNAKLYYSSNGREGLGGLDVFETTIKNEKASKSYNLGDPVNSPYDDFGVYLTEDNKTGYLSSNRKIGGMDDDIYNFTILREVKYGKEVTLITKDKETGETLSNTSFKINEVEVTTNEKGEYATTIEEENTYSVVVEKLDYKKYEENLTVNMDPADSFTRTLLLEKVPKIALIGLVTDIKTNLPLEGVNIDIVELPNKNKFDTYTTTSAGDYRKAITDKKIGDKISYLITLKKEGYVEKQLTFIHDITKAGDINLNETLDLKMGKVAVGMDLAKLIDIKPIYFDLGKSIIRPDAAIELDKIVKVMNDYPNMFIELGSHTDCRGNAAANIKLSTTRAKASAAYIVKKGISALRITGKGYGESKLLNGCKCEGKVKPTCSEDEHAKNRRTEFIIVKLQEAKK